MRYARREAPTFVYRCYDTAGDLLYVGCSINPRIRVETHRVSAWWGDQIATVRSIVFPDRWKALDKEREAIYEEHPRFNVKGRWYRGDDRSHWKERHYRDFYAAVLGSCLDTPHAHRLLDETRAEARARFGVDLYQGPLRPEVVPGVPTGSAA